MRQEESQPIMVTIHCTVYNHEPYIRKCLEGFVMQKTNFRFEAIVHDDASTDGSVAIIREFEKKYPDIIKPIYETENQWSKHDGSLKRIMNKHTFGKYVALCEGDDYWIAPNKLQKQVDFLESHPDYSLCFHNAIAHWTDGSKPDWLTMNETYKEKEYTREELFNNWFYATASFVFNRSVLESKAQNEFNKIKGITGDVPLMMSATTKGRIYGFTDIMSVYNHHNGGISKRNNFYLTVLRQDLAIAVVMGDDIWRLLKRGKINYYIDKSFYELFINHDTTIFFEVLKIVCAKYPLIYIKEAFIYSLKFINYKMFKPIPLYFKKRNN